MSKQLSPFLAKLYELTNEYTPEYECLQWSDDGTHFWVSNVEIFSRDVLPAFYKHNNYASFVRQLNIYGFKRSSEHKPIASPSTPIVEVFRHPYFVRGHKELLAHIHRKSSAASSQARSRADHDDDDVMSMMSTVPELSMPSSELGLQAEVAHLRLKTAELEAYIVTLSQQNQMLHAQQQRQNDTLSAVVQMLAGLGLSLEQPPMHVAVQPQQEQPSQYAYSLTDVQPDLPSPIIDMSPSPIGYDELAEMLARRQSIDTIFADPSDLVFSS